MLIVGKISGIQDYLFDVAAEGGAQAKRLRARSFFMQVLTETLALRTAAAFRLSFKNTLVFCNAGKFALEDENVGDAAAKRLQQSLQSEINRELLRDTAARLSFSLIVSKLEPNSIEADYNDAMRKLNYAKKQAWASVVTANGKWQPANLILSPINEPCELCRQEKSVGEESDDDNPNISRRICQTCRTMREIGKNLTQENKNWVSLSPNTTEGNFKVGDWSFAFAETSAVKNDGYAISLDGSANSEQRDDKQILSRHLVRSIPKEKNKPVEFVELAEKAKGDKLLGLLKMDADSLGKYINELNKKADSLAPLKEFSNRLDKFFAATLTKKLKEPQWKNIYTVFAGGDDLMLVGAWNEVFDFAGVVQRAFALEFGAEKLTISGGLAIFKPKTPIKNAAAEAEELLHDAKEKAAVGEAASRDQFAAFGQIWKWENHEAITKQANEIIRWIVEGKFQRGWLHTLLRLAMLRQRDPHSYASRLATARLANFWTRNFRDNDVWEFGKKLVNSFDEMNSIETKYLAAIARYALTATRSKSTEDNQ